MIEIPLTQGKVALIDDVDVELGLFSWYCGDKGYARRRERGTRKMLFLHRAVLSRKLGRDLLRGEYPDHINRSPLDNRRINLRVASLRQSKQRRHTIRLLNYTTENTHH